MTFDPYKVLGLERQADATAVKAAFRRLSKETHPDKVGGSPEAFIALKRAHRVLSDPEARARYDETGVLDDTENTELGFQDKVTAVQANLFETFIGSGQAFETDRDVIKAMTKVAAAEQASVASNCKAAKTYVAKLETLRNRISRKSGDNLFNRIVEKKVADTHRQIGAMDAEIAILSAAVAELDTYECLTEMAQSVLWTHGLAGFGSTGGAATNGLGQTFAGLRDSFR